MISGLLSFGLTNGFEWTLQWKQMFKVLFFWKEIAYWSQERWRPIVKKTDLKLRVPFSVFRLCHWYSLANLLTLPMSYFLNLPSGENHIDLLPLLLLLQTSDLERMHTRVMVWAFKGPHNNRPKTNAVILLDMGHTRRGECIQKE
jgi:hypothetical protein